MNIDIKDLIKLFLAVLPIFWLVWYLFNKMDKNLNRNFHDYYNGAKADADLKVMKCKIDSNSFTKQYILNTYPETLKNAYRINLIISGCIGIYNVEDEKKIVENGIKKAFPDILVRNLEEIINKEYPNAIR